MAVTLFNYNQFLLQLGNGTLDLDSHSFKAALMSPAFSFNATNTVWADVSSSEITAGNGYVAGGKALTSVSYTQSAGVVTFDFADPEWLAAGGPISNAAYLVIYDDTVAGDPLMFAMNFGATLTAVDGARLVVQLPPTGLFTIGPA